MHIGIHGMYYALICDFSSKHIAHRNYTEKNMNDYIELNAKALMRMPLPAEDQNADILEPVNPSNFPFQSAICHFLLQNIDLTLAFDHK